MPSRCVAAGCCNTSNPRKGISLHRFPCDPECRDIWTVHVRLGRPNWSGPVGEHTMLCSVHFEQQCFDRGLHNQFGMKHKAMLLPCAVPTIFTHQEIAKIPKKIPVKRSCAISNIKQEHGESGRATVTRASIKSANKALQRTNRKRGRQWWTPIASSKKIKIETASTVTDTSEYAGVNSTMMEQGTKIKMPFGCALCGEAFSKLRGLGQHQCSHEGDCPFACLQCGMVFPRKKHLKKHHRIFCEGHRSSKHISRRLKRACTIVNRYMYTCQLCRESFSYEKDCISHFQTHILEKEYRCIKCGNRYFQIGLHQKFVSIHFEQLCSRCNSVSQKGIDTNDDAAKPEDTAGTSDSASLEEAVDLERDGLEDDDDIEIRGTAIGKRLYSCNICRQDFNRVATFCDHQRSCQGYNVVGQDVAQVGEELHGCDVCGDNFTSLSSLNGHRCSHGIDNPEDSDDQVEDDPLPVSVKKEPESDVDNIDENDKDAENSVGGIFICHPCREEFHSIPELDKHRRHCIKQSDGIVPQTLNYLGPVTEPDKIGGMIPGLTVPLQFM